LDPLGFRRGAKQWQGGACPRGGSEVGEGPASRLQAQVSGNYEEGRGSGEEGVEVLISDSGNDHDDSEASFSKSHCLFTCSIDGA
jgi:hypothetical protein